MDKIAIIGCGPGAGALLTGAARDAANRAEVLIASTRLLALFPNGDKERVNVGGDVAKAIAAIEEWRGRKRIALLVSGDPGLSSMAAPVIKKFGHDACETVPGISSVQYAFAKVGIEWEGAVTVSAHARTPTVPPEVLAHAKKIAVLAGTDDALQWTAGLAEQRAMRVVLCENLSLENEKVHELSAGKLRSYRAASLTVVLLIDKECE